MKGRFADAPADADSNTHINMNPAPTDCVSRVTFNPSGTHLLSASWSSLASINDATTGHLLAESPHPQKVPLLDACWTTSDNIAVASLDGAILHSPASLSAWTEVGRHASAARCVIYSADVSLLASAGWDGSLRLWDARSASPAGDCALGGKAFGLARCGPNRVVAITSQRKVLIVDLRRHDQFVHAKMPPALTHQLRGISANEEGSLYVVGSTEGRVAVEWPDEAGRGYSFRCHRQEGLAFPVNAIAHNRKYGSFATGGADGHVAFWDAGGRKRISQCAKQPTSIASVDFSPDSSRIAVAVSYTFEEGEKDHPPDSIHVRELQDSEIKVV